MTSEAWQHFKKGEVQKDGSYPATCNYCGKVYPMGNSRSTTGMTNHWKRACKKIPLNKRYNPDPTQQILQTNASAGNS